MRYAGGKRAAKEGRLPGESGSRQARAAAAEGERRHLDLSVLKTIHHLLRSSVMSNHHRHKDVDAEAQVATKSTSAYHVTSFHGCKDDVDL